MNKELVEAAAWRTYLTERDVASTAALETWLAADARNAAAWRQVQGPWDFFGEQATSPELIALRRAALGHASDMGRKRWLRNIVASSNVRRASAAGLLIAVAGVLAIWNFSKPESYRTATGERRVVTLDDGSRIALDSRTEVRVAYSDKSRELRLLRGQARFDVAHDVQRPFSVLAKGQKVVATGTAFNVDLIGSQVLVTLIEGHVVVLGEGSAASTAGINLNAGQQLALSPAAPPRVAPVNLERAIAWQSGQLVFDNEPLSRVTERVKRYSSRSIEIADAQTASLRMSGVFNAGDVDSFVSTLTSYLPVRAQRDQDGNIKLSRR